MIKEVIDPETNNSIIDLKFLKGYNIDKNGKLTITISPPTFFWPPIFLYMIMEDIKRKLPNVIINVIDHHDAKRLSECINRGLTFKECYQDEAIGNHYEEVRNKFMVEKRGKEDRLTKLSLSINGEFCKLIAEAKEK
ncbi:DUF59 domain-containing protein [Sulfolobus sp. A20-N-F6]|nr:DUF59 domain-containing protein [Sulfolobus sp. E5]TRM76393.1 DUF59 domain-containing protein [Sulfolobus sp. A20-N-F8]TRM80660.1 DUF59 domain-containing protein [Sulfolobus sp. D5]TRM83894.1 DUF59 domain-containing protein [Sulfolobus sp. A20-N-F6]TRM84484.1 DUF59 domain-containing protein [Sulfolobus sp. F3]TRM89494.1 DUF59 domain-containing protein [Sulfolobus sp. C3]TRM96773.1 DUF59 domain-containing protein [Sulfolobus sp. B1]TRN00976.1 DUF59 domain-containing protein [Sulfolobus sp.